MPAGTIPTPSAYRLFESGFRHEIFVGKNGTFPDDEGSKPVKSDTKQKSRCEAAEFLETL
ncbi:hypothetical protein AWV80_29215 [Cupriavidus sp. UYMU48A]|nr:hypothetical protein AWV80_29215 [Cupriavidus sp. UYMU48A]